MAKPDLPERAILDAAGAVRDGLREGDKRAVLLYSSVFGLRPRKPFNPARVVAYAGRRARREERLRSGVMPDAEANARGRLQALNPRDWNYIRRARGIVRLGRGRFGLTEEQGAKVMEEASLAKWRAKNGLEYRFLVGLLMAPEAAPPAFQELRASDFLSWPYAWLFETWRRNGLPRPSEVDAVVTERRNIPGFSPEAWRAEARETHFAILNRRSRWSSR